MLITGHELFTNTQAQYIIMLCQTNTQLLPMRMTNHAWMESDRDCVVNGDSCACLQHHHSSSILLLDFAAKPHQ